MFPILKLLAVLLFKDNRAGFLKPVSQWESVFYMCTKLGDNEYVCLKTHGLTIICRDLYWNERGEEGRNGVVLTSCGCSYGRNP